MTVPGAKNSVLKLMAATLLAPGRYRLTNVPDIADVDTMCELLAAMGVSSTREGAHDLVLEHSGDIVPVAPFELVDRIRASINVLGPLLARLGRADIAMPGGDDFGSRPIDLHVMGLEKMGATFDLDRDGVRATVTDLHGAHIELPFPSVGATENILMAAVLARGVTTIDNAAREPEIGDLCSMLVDMDEQGTATRWAAQATDERPFPASVIGLAPSGGAMHREVRKFVHDYDYILVDCPPAVHSAAPSSALLISDLAIIPVVPSPPDLWAAVAAKTLAQHAQVQNETLQIRVMANMVQRRVSIARQAIEILGDDGDVPLLNSMVGSRSAFRECQAIGCTVHGVPGAREAIQEVDMMVDEILSLIE